MNLRHLFFDAAGTLIQIKQSVGETYSQIAATHQLQLAPATLEQAFRHAWREAQAFPTQDPPLNDEDRHWWRRLVHRTFELALHATPPAATFDPLFADLFQHYASAQAWELYPEVRTALDRLSPHFHLHILSNFDPRLIPVLKGLGIHPLFEQVILSSEAGFRKPDPRLFAHALARTGATPDTAMHIGDEPKADIEGAQNAGFQTFHVQRPQSDLSLLCEKLLS